jgi:hypothetical protein
VPAPPPRPAGARVTVTETCMGKQTTTTLPARDSLDVWAAAGWQRPRRGWRP